MPTSGSEVQVINFYTSESTDSLADVFQTQMSLGATQEESGQCEKGSQATQSNNARSKRDGIHIRANPVYRQVLSSRPTNTDAFAGEPFPDYYESCETNPQLADEAQEKAYNHAISKVVQEVIRFRDVDDTITSLPSPGSQAASWKENTETGKRDGENASDECRPGSQDANKRASFEYLTQLLSDPNLKSSTQQRFMGITNMVIRMEYLLFRQHGLKPPELSLTERDLWELNIMASEIVRYLSTVDEKLQELVDVGHRVAFILSEVAKDRQVSMWVRYRRMAQVVIRQV